MVYISLFGLIASFAVFFSSIGKRRFEEGLPFSFFAIVLILYICGFTCGLAAGVYAVLGLCTAATVFVVIRTSLRKEWKLFFQRLLTPGLLIWIVLVGFTWLVSRNMLVHMWDEFSHWADVVKVMVQYDDFAANVAARSTHSSYPPAMALWQYLAQKVNALLGGTVFSEPLLYMSYQWFAFSLFMPFLKNLSWRRILSAGFSTLVVLLAMTAIFPTTYMQLYIDPFLGMLGGFVLSYALMERKPDGASAAMMCLSLFALVLTKDAAALFAAAGIAAYTLCLRPWKNGRRAWGYVAAALVITVLARGTWSLHVAATNATASGINQELAVSGFWKALVAPESTWQRTTLRNFAYELFAVRADAQNIGIRFSYAAILLLLAVGFVLADAYLPLNERKPLRKITLLCYVTVGSYLIGTCATYLFKLSSEVALRLLSFDRYVCIAISLPFFLLCTQLLLRQYPNGLCKRATALFLTVFLVFAPWSSLLDAASGLYSESSMLSQAEYRQMADQVRDEATEGDEQIYLIAQESTGFEYFVLRHRLRPLVVGEEPWSISAEGITDNYNTVISAEDWRQKLINEGYDFVILYQSNEAFIRDYASVFEQPDQIADRQLYRMNPRTQKLVLVE